MGAQFRLDHVNIMAYVTSRAGAAPRLLRRDLREFLEVLAYNREFLIPERHFDEWPEEISTVAQKALERLDGESDETVAPASVDRVLEPLRSEFSDYPLYALAVGGGDRLRAQARRLAEMPLYGQMLVLIPVQEGSRRNFEVLDPVPVFSRALHEVQQWPGFLFWTTNGVSTFAAADDAERLAHELRDVSERSIPRRRPRRRWPEFGSMVPFDDVLRRHANASRPQPRRLLHISDLHFGTNHALENQALLEAELREVVSKVDRVVITGDLIDSPKPEFAAMFSNFKNGLTHVARGREPIVIPGNHDQRIFGNIGRAFEQIALVGSRKVVVDDDCGMVFVGFNSSERGSFARGKIPSSQFRALGGEYRTLTTARPELKRYLPLVLVHHHPFSFAVPPETWVQRAFRMFGLREETFLEMVNAGDLHCWCADWDIRTILHGHKHKARYVERGVTRSDGTGMNLTAIGCGSSLGAEGSPVSYNLLDWDPAAQRWVASIFESVNGGAFRERLAAVSPEPLSVST
jgi:UDP-2,3-diacylglucosamine pyrophosphatase LpxH